MGFPNDKRVTVIRANGTEYKANASSVLKSHGWADHEISQMQAFESRYGNGLEVSNPFLPQKRLF